MDMDDRKHYPVDRCGKKLAIWQQTSLLKMDNIHDKVTVVIRSVGERTEQACLQIVQSQMGRKSTVHLVKDKPFADAHFECIRLAKDVGTQWSIFLDADILLRKDAIEKMICEAEAVPYPFFMLNFRILDRGFGGPAYGVHFYSNEYFEYALKFEGRAREDQRPETYTYYQVARGGIPTLLSTQLMGLHGYGQFFADVYRTAFVRAVKFNRRSGYFLKRYRYADQRDGKDSEENKVMLSGLLDGLIYQFEHTKAPLNKSLYLEYSDQALSLLGLSEKGPFLLDEDYIESIFSQYAPDESYSANQFWICPSRRIDVPAWDWSPSKMITNGYLLFIYRRLKKQFMQSLTANHRVSRS